MKFSLIANLRHCPEHSWPRLKRFGFASILIIPLLASFACKQTGQVPITTLNPSSSQQETKILDWQILGPFPTGDTNHNKSAGNQSAALEHDYLERLGYRESQLNETDFVAIQRSWFNRLRLSSDFKNVRIHADDGLVRFDKSFTTKTNAVAYAAAVIESTEDAEVVLASGVDDTLRAWVNGELKQQSKTTAIVDQPIYGSLGRTANMTSVRLKKGRNFLLVKVFQTIRMWGVNCSLLTLPQARQQAQNNGLYFHNVVEHAILAPGTALALDPTLGDLLHQLKVSASLEIFNSAKEKIAHYDIDQDQNWSQILTALNEGVYSCKFSSTLFSLEEPFYYGDTERWFDSFKAHVESPNFDAQAKISLNALMTRYLHLTQPANKQTDNQDWQKKIVYLIKESEDLFARLALQQQTLDYPGTHLRGFRSRVDNQIQHYMVHIPKQWDKSRGPLPLVVIVPFPLPNHPFLKSVHVANTSLIDTYARLADRYGYGLVWPFARGNPDGSPLAVTDILETLEAVNQNAAFDQQRTYLLGWSFGATYALLLGQRFPGKFAAIGAVMPPSDLVAFEKNARYIHSPYPDSWLKLNSPIELAGNLSNTPVYIIHGAEDTTVAPQQSIDLVNKLRSFGCEARLDILPAMDHVYSPADPTQMLFEFFKDKTLKLRPEKVSLTTAQLKYGSAYWLKVLQLKTPAAFGTITARRTSPTSIEVHSENVLQYEILLKELEYSRGSTLTISTNGRQSFAEIPKGDTIRINIEELPEDNVVYKNSEVEGPILHALAGPFIVVTGTTGSEADRTRLSQLRDKFRRFWMKDYFVDCEFKNDVEITSEEIANKHLVLLGNAETNSLVNKIMPALPIKLDREYVVVGDQRYEGGNLGVEIIYPNPLNQRKYVVLIAANDQEGADRMELNLSLKGWYDVAVWNLAEGQAKVIGVGYWDNWWRRFQPMPNP